MVDITFSVCRTRCAKDNGTTSKQPLDNNVRPMSKMTVIQWLETHHTWHSRTPRDLVEIWLMVMKRRSRECILTISLSYLLETVWRSFGSITQKRFLQSFVKNGPVVLVNVVNIGLLFNYNLFTIFFLKKTTKETQVRKSRIIVVDAQECT